MLRTSLLIAIVLTAAACAPQPMPPTTIQSGETEPADFSPTIVTESDIPSDIHQDSWGRLPLPDRTQLNSDEQRAYDLIVNPESRYATGPRGPVAMWLYSPEMAEHIFPASTYLRFGTTKDQRLTELAILVAAREVRSQYEWSAHEPLGLAAGLEPEIIELVKHRRPVETTIAGLGALEQLIIKFGREVISSQQVSSDTFREARALLGERGVMELTGLIGYYNFVNITLKAFDVQLAPGRTRLLPDLWSNTEP